MFGLVAAVPWGRRVGAVLGAVVFSRWLLDLPMHRGDMPILPGHGTELPRLGFGLWRIPAASALLELAFVLVGARLYWRAARDVTTDVGRGERDARIAAGALLVAGLVTLGLGVMGK